MSSFAPKNQRVALNGIPTSTVHAWGNAPEISNKPKSTMPPASCVLRARHADTKLLSEVEFRMVAEKVHRERRRRQLFGEGDHDQ